MTAHFEKYETEVKLFKKLYSTAFQGVNVFLFLIVSINLK